MSISESLFSLLPLALMVLIVGGIVAVGRRRAATRAAQGAEPLSGVGGWLLLLVLGFTVLGPLVGGGRINSEFMQAETQNAALSTLPLWATMKTYTWIVFAATTVVGVYAGVGLLRSRMRFVVTQAKVALWLVGPFAALMYGIVIPLMVVEAAPAEEAVFAVIASAISAAIWHVYLSRSVRVRNTYL